MLDLHDGLFRLFVISIILSGTMYLGGCGDTITEKQYEYGDEQISPNHVTASTELNSGAKERATEIAYRFPGKMGIYAKNLLTSESIAINADTSFYLASVSKVPILVGAMDRLKLQSFLRIKIPITIQDYREEYKYYGYHHVGFSDTLKNHMKAVISHSDTTATDLILRVSGESASNEPSNHKPFAIQARGLGQHAINAAIKNLNIPNIGEMTSLDYAYAYTSLLCNPQWADFPSYATQAWIRGGNAEFVYYNLPDVFPIDDCADNYQRRYFATGLNSASPRAMGELLEGIVNGSLLTPSWKNQELLNIFTAAAPGDVISNIIPQYARAYTKGGTYSNNVHTQLSLIKIGDTPVAVIALFTENYDLGVTRDTIRPYILEAARYALEAIGAPWKEQKLPVANQSSGQPQLVFQSPKPGQYYQAGDNPVIQWDSANIVGNLMLQLYKGNSFVSTISNSALNDGEWHSWIVPEYLDPAANYRFKLIGVDSANNQIIAFSNFFAIEPQLRVIAPGFGTTLQQDSFSVVVWDYAGIEDEFVTVRVLRYRMCSLPFGGVVINYRCDDVIRSFPAVNTGYASLYLPGDVEAGSDYFVRISNDDKILGEGERFNVGNKLKITKPIAGSRLNIDTNPIIEWESSGSINQLLEIGVARGYLDQWGQGKVSYRSVFSNVAYDDGEWHSWTVPANVNNGNYYLFYLDPINGSAPLTPGPFVQIGSSIEWRYPSIEQGLPNDYGAAYVRPAYIAWNTTPTLKWETRGGVEGNDAEMKIDLLRDSSVVTNIALAANDDGEWHSWTVSNALNASSNYQLRIQSITEPSVSAISLPFQLGAKLQARIKNPTVNSLPRFKLADRIFVYWVSENISGTLTIKIVKPINSSGGETVVKSFVTDFPSNIGFWVSDVIANYNDDIPLNTPLRIKVTSNANPAMYSYTQWFMRTQ